MVSAIATKVTAKKIILLMFSILEAFPSPNFIENIGTSLTSNRLRARASTGSRKGPEHHEAKRLSGTL